MEPSSSALSVFDMDAESLQAVNKLSDLQHFVDQLERMPGYVIGPDLQNMMVPLTEILTRKRYQREGALLCERILFHCLSRMPAEDENGKVLDYSSSSGEDTNVPEYDSVPQLLAKLYQHAIMAWGNKRSVKGALRAQRLFDLMRARNQHVQKAEQAETLISPSDHNVDADDNNVPEGRQQQHPQHPSPYTAPAPGFPIYMSLLRAWAVSDSPEGPDKAYMLLKEIEDLSGITSLLERRGMEGVNKATKDEIPLVYSGSMEPPNLMCYNSTLWAFSRSLSSKKRGSSSLQRVLKLVEHMDRLYALTEDPRFQLDEHSFHAILNAYSLFVDYSPPKLKMDTAEEIERLLKRMTEQVRPEAVKSVMSTGWAFGVVVAALTKTQPLETSIPRAYNFLLYMVNNARQSNDRSEFWPQIKVVLSVIQGLDHLKQPESPDRINELVSIMADTPYENSRLFYFHAGMLQVSQQTFPFAAEAVELMLERALERQRHRDDFKLKPNGQTFAISLKAWYASKQDDAPMRAELILKKMTELFEAGDHWYRPREAHLRFVALAWLTKCNSGKRYQGVAGNLYPAEHIEALLLHFERSNELPSFSNIYPLGILAWVNQKLGECDDDPDPLEHAVKLLELLFSRSGTYSAYASNLVLEVCARQQSAASRRKEAYEVAIATFSKCQRNPRTYSLMFKVLLAHVDQWGQEHTSFVEEMFHEISSNGLLTQELIWQTACLVPSESLQKLFGVSSRYAQSIVEARDSNKFPSPSGPDQTRIRLPSALLVENLPREWTRCVNKNAVNR